MTMESLARRTRTVHVRHAVRSAVEAFILSRIVLLAVTVVAAGIQRRAPVAVWDQWDTVWYLGIAAHGYGWAAPGHEATIYHGSSLAFFPLFPLLVRCLEGIGLAALVAGLMVANVAFFGALLYLYGLLREEWGARVARLSLLLFALFPTAFFTFAPYTESLFLLAAAATLFHARRGHFALTGFWLAVGLLTRSTAVILFVPAAMMLRPRGLRQWLLYLGPTVAGWALYLTYLAGRGIPLAWLLSAQRAWHRSLAFPWMGFTGSVDWLLRHGQHQVAMAVDNVFNLALTLGFLALTLLAWRELSRPLRFYCAGFWLLILLSPQWLDGYYAPFGSVDRFVLALFPLAGWVTRRILRHRLNPAIVVSAVGMAVMAALHVSGVWVG